MKHNQVFVHQRQRGAVLVVSLLMLLVLTILAITASQSTRMQERMAGNARNADLAFQAAEAGLRDAETFLDNQIVRPDTCSTLPLTATCQVLQRDVLPANAAFETPAWWLTNTQQYGTDGAQEIQGVVRDPQFVIEELGFIPDSLTVGRGAPAGRTFYRNTSQALGANDTAQAVVQSTFPRRF